MTHGIIAPACRTPLSAGSLFFFSALLFFCLTAFYPGKARAAEAPAVIWQAGPITIYAIQDRPGGMDVSLFSGPATPEERARYFEDGKADASISVFLIKAGGESKEGPGVRYALVDAGMGDAAPGESNLIPALASLGIGPEAIETVLLTHMHIDHIGGLMHGGKRAFPNARIAVSRDELNYWLSVRDPDNANARLVSAIMSAYGTSFTPPFSFSGKLSPELTAIDASGHTPGHTAFLFDVAGKKLLIFGDLVHAAALQFPLPDECASYDMDKDAAVAARKRILGKAADEKVEVAGMHTPFPGNGMVERDGEGFRLVAPVKTE